MSPTSDISPGEFELLKILWDLKTGSVADVRRTLKSKGRDLAYTTVMTLLGRLEKKGAVKVDKSEQPFRYRPLLKRRAVVKQRISKFVDAVFDGRADELALHLLAQEGLSSSELERIEKLLDDDDGDES